MKLSASLAAPSLGLCCSVSRMPGQTRLRTSKSRRRTGPTFAADGLVVHATVGGTSGGSRPVVVLAPSSYAATARGSRAAQLGRGVCPARVTTLAIDLRGHGRSKVDPDGSARIYAAAAATTRCTSAWSAMWLGGGGLYPHHAPTPSRWRSSARRSVHSSLVAFADDAQLAMLVALSPGSTTWG